MRVVTFCHMHPKEKPSGSGWVAWHLSRILKKHFGVEPFFFGGRCERSGNLIEECGQDPFHEYLVETASDSFMRTQLERQVLFSCLREQLEAIDPDIIHFHSIHTLGFDMLREVFTKRAKRVMTLHNYVPICLNNGWLMRPGSNALCYGADPTSCTSCYSHVSGEFLRHHRDIVFRYLNSMDMLTTPGKFAQGIYLGFGLPPERLRYIPNGVDIQPLRRERPDDGMLHIGFFGQIGLHKGLDVLLTAINLLPFSLQKQRKIHLHIFGSGLSGDAARLPELYAQVLPKPYIERLFSLLSTVEDLVTLHGPYLHHTVNALLASVDCIVVPSLWWEVTPCVIQEALACGRPVICSNIGGMVEMVRDGIDGLHFEVNNPHDLKDKLLYFHENIENLRSLGSISPQTSMTTMAENFYDLYAELTTGASA